ncbi:MAG: hypothetical protein HRT36_08375 [Alphaproteobacteria bacterium]|nr:hypothetical protein [Alphaproteobacteria bacterium]
MAMIETEYALKSGREAFGKMLHSGTKPSIVMCGDNVLAECLKTSPLPDLMILKIGGSHQSSPDYSTRSAQRHG